MRSRGQGGSIVSLLCDRGERYAETLFNTEWRAALGLDVDPSIRALRQMIATKASLRSIRGS